MNCTKCGIWLGPKMVEGSDYIIDAKKNWWCVPCMKRTLSTAQFYEEMADEPMRYREALISTLQWSINEGYCVKPKERCQASADKCLKCWLNYLVGEEMEG